MPICPSVLRASEYAPPSVCDPSTQWTPNARPCRIRRSRYSDASCATLSSSTKNSWNSSMTSSTRGIASSGRASR